jgi:hypothetical protein
MKCRRFAATRRSFILVEIVMSMFALSMIVGGIMSGTLLMAEISYFSEDSAIARDRADNVFSIMRLPADMCGYGMPRGAAEYKTAFRGGTGSPFNWEGVVDTLDIKVEIDNKSVWRTDASCRIVYGIPTKIYTKCETEVSGGSLNLRTDDSPGLLESVQLGKPNSVKNWIISGSLTPRRPMWLKTSSKSGPENILHLMYNEPDEEPAPMFIPENDRLFYMGAMDWRVLVTETDFVFYVNNLRGGGTQPVQNGVVDARFELDETKRTLKVWLLVRGDRMYSEVRTAGIPSGWPVEYSANIPTKARHYRLFAFSESFALKNF